MTRVLVTGATGLVGSYVAERLLADGCEVRALVRAEAQTGWLGARGVELVQGDVRDEHALRRAAHGCDGIVHAAAHVSPTGTWQTFHDLNVVATARVVSAAAAAGARLLHVSSVAVYGGTGRYRDAPTDEDVPFAPLRPDNHYARSKREAEALVLDAHASGRVWAAAVRPDVVYGVRDRQFVPRVARLLRHGFAPLLAGGRSTLAVVHAANVADGIARALSCDAAGGRAYNLANDFDVTVERLVHLAGEGLGRRVRPVHLSGRLARGALTLARGASAAVGGSGLLAHLETTLLFLMRDNPFTSGRARRELGWNPPVRPEVGIPQAFRWWREHMASGRGAAGEHRR